MKYLVFLALVAVAHCAAPKPVSLPEPSNPTAEHYISKIESVVLRNQLRMLPSSPALKALARTIAKAEQQLMLTRQSQEAIRAAENEVVDAVKVADAVVFEVDPVYAVKVVDAPVEAESKVADSPVEAVKVVDVNVEAPVVAAEQVKVAEPAMPVPAQQIPKSFLRNK